MVFHERNWMAADTRNVTRPIVSTSAPNNLTGWFGTSPMLARTKAATRMTRPSAARPGNWEMERIRARLIDMATTRSPVSAAAAPTSATKKFAQSALGGFMPSSKHAACQRLPRSG
jgi:hypothetical protein